MDRRKIVDVKYIDFSKAFDNDDILLSVPCSISLSFIISVKNNLEENENLILTNLKDPFKLNDLLLSSWVSPTAGLGSLPLQRLLANEHLDR